MSIDDIRNSLLTDLAGTGIDATTPLFDLQNLAAIANIGALNTLRGKTSNSQLIYGKADASNLMVRSNPVLMSITGGDNAWGTEIQISDGAVFENDFDLSAIYVASVSAANKMTLLRFYANEAGADTACTFTGANDTVNKVAHGLSNGDRVMIVSAVSNTGPNAETVYHVVEKAADTFKLSLTAGGAAIDIAGADAAGVYCKITQELMTEVPVSKAATTSDALPEALVCPKTASDKRISVVAKSVTGATVAVGYMLGVRTY